MAYVALPQFRAPDPLDFRGLNEGIDDLNRARERNRLLAEQRQIGADLASQPQGGSPPVSYEQPTNKLLSPKSTPAQYQSGNVIDRIIGAESGGRANAINPRSSATGAGQFISSTWLDTIKRARPDLAAGKSDAELLSLRNDPNLSREMTSAYASENGKALQGAGFEATPGNTYLAHFAGPQGARSVLSSDPNAPVRQVLGDRVVQANPFLGNMTAGQLRQWADRKMGGASSQPSASPATAPTSQRSGLNYAAGIQSALKSGNVALAMQLQNAQQEAETLNYNRQRQGVQDQQSAESHGLTTQGQREALQQNAVKKIGAIAQVIQSQTDPAKKAQMWQRFLQSDPSFGPDLQAMGVDPADVEAGTRMLVAQAGGVSEATRPIEVNGNLVQKQPDGSYKSVYTAPTRARNLTTGEQKEVFEADEGVQAGNNVVNSLTKALELNSQAYSGPAAQTRGYLTSLVGADGGVATEDLGNVITGQVLENLKATFGAAPTEGERQILVESPEVRQRIYERAMQAANRRIEFNRQKAGALRSGEYFQPGFTPTAPSEAQVQQQAAAPQAGAPVRVNTPDEAMKLPSGTVFQTPDGRNKVRP
jgi:hypothetical protein